MVKKILWISDLNFEGSGYFYISTALCNGLAKEGYEIKIIGLGYMGEEHWNPYSIIPSKDVQESATIAQSLISSIGDGRGSFDADVVIVALDIPLQQIFFEKLSPILTKAKKKYIAITPLENGPLTMSWAFSMLNMDWIFFISELGKTEAKKAGLTNVEHLQIGVDTFIWHPATKEEKLHLRNGLGINEDEFVILTVADNQERKNLWAGFEIISNLKKETQRKIRHIDC